VLRPAPGSTRPSQAEIDATKDHRNLVIVEVTHAIGKRGQGRPSITLGARLQLWIWFAIPGWLLVYYFVLDCGCGTWMLPLSIVMALAFAGWGM
jgi:hypothetical protein